jgi:hypothetical protein
LNNKSELPKLSPFVLYNLVEPEIQSSLTTKEDWIKRRLREVFTPEAKTKKLEASVLGMVAEDGGEYKK